MSKLVMTAPSATSRRSASAGSISFSEAERNQVLDHLEDIFLSPVFRNSKRYCALLRYVVERSLEGQADQLKERTIGVEAFGRQADYDTNADHSVRSAAGEVRRRLAQYYMEYGSASGIRIELLTGSYVPTIHRASTVEEIPSPAALPEPPAPVITEIRRAAPRPAAWRRFQNFLIPGAILALLVLIFAVWLGIQELQTPFDRLWKPILSSPNAALVCFGGGQQPAAAPSVDHPQTLSEFEHMPARRMNVSDALALVSVTGTLRAKGKPYRILSRANATTFKDLQQGPFILIGAMNNEWSLRLTSGLRFTFDRQPNGVRIADKQNPANTAWNFSYDRPVDQPARDYAIVTRLRDRLTEQSGLIVAGIGSWGTQAAGEFVSNPDNVRKIESLAPPHWEQKNLQVVIGTDIIRGSPGPPIVLAAYFW